MRQSTREVVERIAALRGISVSVLLGDCRKRRVFQARIEIAKILDGHGYSSTVIGKVFGKDHTTILFYLGKLDRKPTALRWKAPRVRTLLVIWRAAPPRPKRHRYLIPYAGADMSDYRWQERPRCQT